MGISRFATIGIGSNKGERKGFLQKGIELLHQGKNITVLACSPLYESDALLLPESPPEWNTPFLNGVLLIEVETSPLELLASCQQIEHELGRVRKARWEPRTLDLDILFFEGITSDCSICTLPHPAIATRPFVLLPLLDLTNATKSKRENQFLFSCLTTPITGGDNEETLLSRAQHLAEQHFSLRPLKTRQVNSSLCFSSHDPVLCI